MMIHHPAACNKNNTIARHDVSVAHRDTLAPSFNQSSQLSAPVQALRAWNLSPRQQRPLHPYRVFFLPFGRRFSGSTRSNSVESQQGRIDRSRRTGTSRKHPAQSMGVLVRDFIHRALYDAKIGYFAARNVVGTLMSPLNFRSLLGRPEVEAKLAKSLLSVEGNAEAWLTPAEVFAPYFSQAVASYIVKQFRARQKKVPGQLRQLGKKRSGKKRRSHRNGAGAQ